MKLTLSAINDTNATILTQGDGENNVRLAATSGQLVLIPTVDGALQEDHLVQCGTISPGQSLIMTVHNTTTTVNLDGSNCTFESPAAPIANWVFIGNGYTSNPVRTSGCATVQVPSLSVTVS